MTQKGCNWVNLPKNLKIQDIDKKKSTENIERIIEASTNAPATRCLKKSASLLKLLVVLQVELIFRF